MPGHLWVSACENIFGAERRQKVNLSLLWSIQGSHWASDTELLQTHDHTISGPGVSAMSRVHYLSSAVRTLLCHSGASVPLTAPLQQHAVFTRAIFVPPEQKYEDDSSAAALVLWKEVIDAHVHTHTRKGRSPEEHCTWKTVRLGWVLKLFSKIISVIDSGHSVTWLIFYFFQNRGCGVVVFFLSTPENNKHQRSWHLAVTPPGSWDWVVNAWQLYWINNIAAKWATHQRQITTWWWSCLLC